MASIADVYVTLLPESSKIADGIKKGLLEADDDVRRAAGRWKRIIDRELSGEKATVDVDADTAKAKSKLDKDAPTVELDAQPDTHYQFAAASSTPPQAVGCPGRGTW